MEEGTSSSKKKKKRKGIKWRNGRIMLISLGNTIILLLLSYILNNQALFTGEDLNQYAWMEFIKEKIGLSEHIDYKDALFINVAYDKQLVDKCDEFGMPIGNIDITDRTKLLGLLNLLTETNTYRYIIFDVRFEKGLDSEADSSLFAKIRQMNKVAFANHKDIELADSTLSSKAAFNDYASTIVASNFARYKFIQNGQSSQPLYVYHELTNKTIKKHGLSYTCDGRLCQNSHFLRFPSNGFTEYDEKGNKTYYQLGSDILANYSKSELAALTKDKLVFVGDMVNDVHDTYAGPKPGTIITYHALRSLLKNEHLVSYGLMFFLGVLFFLISLSLFSQVSVIKWIPFIRNKKSRVLQFMLSFIGYAFVLTATTTVLYMFFDQSISILLPSLYFSIQKSIINHTRAKS